MKWPTLEMKIGNGVRKGEMKQGLVVRPSALLPSPLFTLPHLPTHKLSVTLTRTLPTWASRCLASPTSQYTSFSTLAPQLQSWEIKSTLTRQPHLHCLVQLAYLLGVANTQPLSPAPPLTSPGFLPAPDHTKTASNRGLSSCSLPSSHHIPTSAAAKNAHFLLDKPNPSSFLCTVK